MGTQNQQLTSKPHLAQYQFKPGQSGNPGGIGGGRKPSLITALYKELAKTGQSGKTQNEEVSAELVRLALYAKSEDTQLRAITEIMNRMHGRPNQSISIEHTSDDTWRDNVTKFINECRALGYDKDPITDERLTDDQLREQAERCLSEVVIEVTAENVETVPMVENPDVQP